MAVKRLGRPWEGVKTDRGLGLSRRKFQTPVTKEQCVLEGGFTQKKSYTEVCHGSPVSGYGFGYGSVTVLVTVVNIPPSPLIAQPTGLITCIHRGSVTVCHSCSL